MALTNADIIDSIMERIGFTKNRSYEATGILIEIIKRTLSNGKDVLVSRLGKFCVNQKASRKGR